jgi:hypothetical protein
MKNVHVLPTEKPSRLGYIFELESYHIFTNGEDANDLGDNLATNRHIYITDDSEIEEGDWFLCLDNTKCNDSTYKCNEVWLNMEEKQPSYCKKIILTTDTDLIADGVQAIDDEFLEWFVQNPTCEVVGVKLLQASRLTGELGDCSYHITLPQDEAKQEPIDEFIEKEVYEEGMFSPHIWSDGVRAGAAWQAERMYSEEEVLRIIQDLKSYLGFGDEVAEKEWFNQFKKQKS